MTQKPHIPFVTFPVDTIDVSIMVPLITEATLELGRYDGTLSTIVNPQILLSPLTNNEAILSSRIEGTIASLTEVLQYDESQKAERHRENDLKEIVNYRSALVHAKRSIQDRDISISLIKELHAILMTDVRGGDRSPGQIRTDQNWIGTLASPYIKDARFIPPSPENLVSGLDNFEKFIATTFINDLVKLAIIHAQFEILHPFNDGNGRLGRMLIPLFLYKAGFIQSPAFYMSEFLEKNDQHYRDRLLAITENDDWQGWCTFFLQGIAEQAKWNNKRSVEIIKLYNHMKVAFLKTTQSKFSQPALDAFFNRPIINATTFIKETKIDTRSTANTVLGKLVDAGLIKSVRDGTGRTPALYIMPKIIDIIDKTYGYYDNPT